MTLSVESTPQNLQLIGGEMLVWTDNEPAEGRLAVGGGAVEELLRGLVRPGGRALIAGPHDRRLIELLDTASMQLTCVVRAYPDAAELAEAFPRMQVLCGSIAKIEVEEPFDLVLALDGAERLVSAEGVAMSWRDTVGVLRRAVHVGGTLVFGQENLLGVHRLVRMSPWYGEHSSADWTPVGEYDETRPNSPADLNAKLGELGLEVHQRYLGFATPAEPTVLFTDDLATDPDLNQFLRVAVSAACGAQFAGVPVLSDPRALATSALRAGAGATVAPVWVVVAGNNAVPRTGSRVLVSEPSTDPWPIRYEVTRQDGTWSRRVLGDARTTSRDMLRRDPAALAGPLPAGQLLEECLVDLCLRRDLPELARLLTRYAGWLADGADQDGQLRDAMLYATTGDVLVGGDGFDLWDRTWFTTSQAPVGVALARSLRVFTVKLITGGYSHPWPTTADADSLTVILSGLAGHPLERPELTAAIELEVQLRAAQRGLDGPAREQLRDVLATVTSGTPLVDLDSHRELRMALDRMADELVHAQARTAWAEELLTSREKALRNAEAKLDVLSGSLTYRIGRLIMMPLRVLKRAAKAVLARTSNERSV